MEKIITIELLGEPFKFLVEDDSKANPDDIAAFLMDAVQQVEVRFPDYARKTSKLAIMVLAALNITKQYFELLENHSEFLKTMSCRAARMERIIDSNALR